MKRTSAGPTGINLEERRMIEWLFWRELRARLEATMRQALRPGGFELRHSTPALLAEKYGVTARTVYNWRRAGLVAGLGIAGALLAGLAGGNAQTTRAPKDSTAVHDTLSAKLSTCTSPVGMELNDGSRAVVTSPDICICKDLAVRVCGAPGH